MSSTRHAEPGGSFRQERYASSNDDDGRLLANLVARRCQSIENRSEIEVIMFIQWASHQPGGLKRLANAIEKRLLAEDATYNRHRREWPGRMQEAMEALSVPEDEGWRRPWTPRPRVDAIPTVGADESKISELLFDHCINPKSRELNLFGASIPLAEALRSEMVAQSEGEGSKIAETEISRQVVECLDYALESNALVLIEGDARIGKSFAARNWCQRRPGLVRYVQVPSSNDEKAFHRKIAEAVGVSCSASKKGLEIRERVESAVQGVKLMLVLDEAHYLWPQVNTRVARPKRINWIMTELVNYGVPVALITTQQFTNDQQRVEKNTGWASEQFIGRIAHYRKLPRELSHNDLKAVARFHVPEGAGTIHEALACYATISRSYVAGIEHVVRRARFEAQRAGDSQVKIGHVKKVIECFALPSDSALKERLEGQGRRKGLQPTQPIEPSPVGVAAPVRRGISPGGFPVGDRSGSLVASS